MGNSCQNEPLDINQNIGCKFDKYLRGDMQGASEASNYSGTTKSFGPSAKKREKTDKMKQPSDKIFTIIRKEFTRKVSIPSLDEKYRRLPSAGPILLEDGSTYKGQMYKNNRYGFGETVYVTGDMYEGYYDNDKRNGLGRLFLANGRVYDGAWANDCWHGPGRLYYSANEYYEGSFEYGKKNGFGKHRYPDGSYFEGFWNMGQRDGEGTLYNINTHTKENQIWVSGKRVNEHEMVLEESVSKGHDLSNDLE